MGTCERGGRYEGLTALHHAAYYGNVETVQVILELGGNAHTRSVKIEGRIEPARVLVETGGDLCAQGACGGTALHFFYFF